MQRKRTLTRIDNIYTNNSNVKWGREKECEEGFGMYLQYIGNSRCTIHAFYIGLFCVCLRETGQKASWDLGLKSIVCWTSAQLISSARKVALQ